MRQAILNSADLLKDGDFDGIRNLVEKAIKAGVDKDMGHEYNKDVESRYRATYRPAIPTPWPILNEGIQGGFGPGDLAIVFGNPGGGKSWTMVAIAAHAVKLGFNVIYYSLELGEDYVGKRFDCYFTGYSIDEVNNHRQEVQSIVDNLTGKLIIKEYPPKSASVNTIKSHIQKCTDMGSKPDLVVIDYVDYLRAPSKSRFAERKDEIDDVFIATKGLAKEMKVPILTPSQVNRMGAKDSVIEGDKAAGSYDKMMVADMCFSLSRQKEDKVLGTGRFHVMKNRYGQDGMTYNVKMDTNNGHIDFEGKTDPSDILAESTKPKFTVSREIMEKLLQ
jgi:replicative DNA helicase